MSVPKDRPCDIGFHIDHLGSTGKHGRGTKPPLWKRGGGFLCRAGSPARASLPEFVTATDAPSKVPVRPRARVSPPTQPKRAACVACRFARARESPPSYPAFRHAGEGAGSPARASLPLSHGRMPKPLSVPVRPRARVSPPPCVNGITLLVCRFARARESPLHGQGGKIVVHECRFARARESPLPYNCKQN